MIFCYYFLIILYFLCFLRCRYGWLIWKCKWECHSLSW
jgi:hypothetical protein